MNPGVRPAQSGFHEAPTLKRVGIQLLATAWLTAVAAHLRAKSFYPFFQNPSFHFRHPVNACYHSCGAKKWGNSWLKNGVTPVELGFLFQGRPGVSSGF
jgi:hypothetical protein